jgi:hypothetical protein
VFAGADNTIDLIHFMASVSSSLVPLAVAAASARPPAPQALGGTPPVKRKGPPLANGTDKKRHSDAGTGTGSDTDTEDDNDDIKEGRSPHSKWMRKIQSSAFPPKLFKWVLKPPPQNACGARDAKIGRRWHGLNIDISLVFYLPCPSFSLSCWASSDRVRMTGCVCVCVCLFG